ncbi:jg2419 [Pararge aegeria aegeria]|uniref:Jg2419 protein n=1 Tax=Pararge aegeria aegeria TaxID=348720 RepID=A0A8S4S448_9NEOP|nr:jg2419 [Pararge aegeria aegeria]
MIEPPKIQKMDGSMTPAAARRGAGECQWQPPLVDSERGQSRASVGQVRWARAATARNRIQVHIFLTPNIKLSVL